MCRPGLRLPRFSLHVNGRSRSLLSVTGLNTSTRHTCERTSSPSCPQCLLLGRHLVPGQSGPIASSSITQHGRRRARKTAWCYVSARAHDSTSTFWPAYRVGTEWCAACRDPNHESRQMCSTVSKGAFTGRVTSDIERGRSTPVCSSVLLRYIRWSLQQHYIELPKKTHFRRRAS